MCVDRRRSAYLSYIKDEIAEALGLSSAGVEQERANIFGESSGGEVEKKHEKCVETLKSCNGDIDAVC